MVHCCCEAAMIDKGEKPTVAYKALVMGVMDFVPDAFAAAEDWGDAPVWPWGETGLGPWLLVAPSELMV